MDIKQVSIAHVTNEQEVLTGKIFIWNVNITAYIICSKHQFTI